MFSVGNDDIVLPVVPMFHANAWGLPFACAMTGAALVLPGPRLDAVSVLDLLAEERVTMTAGVPTVWMSVLAALDAEPKRWDLGDLERMIVGGSAVPASMIDGFDRHGLKILQAWGMTETSPLGTVSHLPREIAKRPQDERTVVRARQGRPVPLVEIRACNDAGAEIAWDDEAMGELQVRGPWVASAYHRGEGAEKFTADGWFTTGDIVTIDARGSIKICDRSKDLIKSGGEWISSVDLENALMAHPAVAEAAVIAIADERWAERPLAVVVLREGAQADADVLRTHLSHDFAKWQLPERIEYIDAIPRTATGKWKKTVLRERFGAAARRLVMRQLTSLDAQFLAVEDGRTHGHVTALGVYDPSTAPGGQLTLAAVRELVAERMHLLPPFRWRLAEVPFGLDHPYWFDDPDFDLEYHVRELALPAPGDQSMLCEQVARIVARPLDRKRPLWELYIIHGLAGRPCRRHDQDAPCRRRRHVRRRDPQRPAGDHTRCGDGIPAAGRVARRTDARPGLDARARCGRPADASRCAASARSQSAAAPRPGADDAQPARSCAHWRPSAGVSRARRAGPTAACWKVAACAHRGHR